MHTFTAFHTSAPAYGMALLFFCPPLLRPNRNTKTDDKETHIRPTSSPTPSPPSPLPAGLALLQPLIALHPFGQDIPMMPWKDIETTSNFGIDRFAYIEGGYHSVCGLNSYQLDVPTLVGRRRLHGRRLRRPSGLSSVVSCGGYVCHARHAGGAR